MLREFECLKKFIFEISSDGFSREINLFTKSRLVNDFSQDNYPLSNCCLSDNKQFCFTQIVQ